MKYWDQGKQLISSLFFLLIILFEISGQIYPQDFWEETGGPEGGFVNCLAISNDNVIFAGFNAGNYGPSHMGKALYKLNNTSVEWTPISSNIPKDISSIVIDTLNRIVIWSHSNGIFRSTDNGVTWLHPGFPVFPTSSAQLGVFKNNTLVISVGDELYFSSDNAISWNLNPLTGEYRNLFIDQSDGLYVSFDDGTFYKSTDYGYSWIPTATFGTVLCMCESRDSTLYAGTASYMYFSKDDGLTWNRLDDSPTSVSSLAAGSSRQIFAATSGGIYVSEDTGENWKLENNGLKDSSVSVCLSIPPGKVIAGTRGGGIYRYYGGSTGWKSMNNGIKSVNIGCIYRHNNYLFAASRERLIYRSEDNGENWEHLAMPDNNYEIKAFTSTKMNSLFCIDYLQIYKSDNDGESWTITSNIGGRGITSVYDSTIVRDYIFSAKMESGIQRSSDNGLTWETVFNGNGVPFTTMTGFPNGPVFACNSFEIYRSTDFGESWESVYTSDPTVYQMNMAASLNGYLYAAMDWGKVILSTDFGETWIDKGQNLSIIRVNSITTDSLNRVYIGNWDGKIYQSLDFGEHWIDIQSGMIGGPILNLYCDQRGNIFVGPYGGSVYKGVNSTFVLPAPVLYSPASGVLEIALTPTLSWYSTYGAEQYRVQCSVNNTFDSSAVILDYTTADTFYMFIDSLEVNTKYYWRTACLNQYGWSLWSAAWWFKTLSATAVGQEHFENYTFNLSQNFPNPFNPSTTIKYELNKSGLVQLKVYDILGNEVKTLVNEFQSSGRYSVNFNGKELSSGIYIYQLKSGTSIQTKKLILLK